MRVDPREGDPPRLVPGRAFPPYAYHGSPQPHPVHDPRGHSHGASAELPLPLVPGRWRESEDYLFGFDLFNRGYYWEAHELWEGLWNAAARRGPVGGFLQGLIKLAAAGVKARNGSEAGVRKHSRRAIELFEPILQEAREVPSGQFAGISPGELIDFAREIGERAAGWPSRPGDEPRAVFDRILVPGAIPPRS